MSIDEVQQVNDLVAVSEAPTLLDGEEGWNEGGPWGYIDWDGAAGIGPSLRKFAALQRAG